VATDRPLPAVVRLELLDELFRHLLGRPSVEAGQSTPGPENSDAAVGKTAAVARGEIKRDDSTPDDLQT